MTINVYNPKEENLIIQQKKDDDLKNPNHLKEAWSKTGISKIGRNENKRVIHVFLKEHKKHVKTNSEDKR